MKKHQTKENFILEQSRDIEADRKAEQNRESQESIFDNWKSDNIKELQEDFIIGYEQEFIDFCKEEFNKWGKD